MPGGSTLSALPRHGPSGGALSSPPSSKGGTELRSQAGTPLGHRQPYHHPYHNPGRMMNLMFDPRVIRGPTQPHQHKKPEHSIHDHPATKKLNKAKVACSTKNALMTSSEPCTTRKHLDVQTDAYLEEFVEKVSEFDMDTQTDPFLDRPPTPLFIPQKSGPDAGTQIEEGELFNFDDEVEPILEVLVGRTLEQSVMEVMEEKQLANLHAYQEHFEQIRAAELVATQRMEAAERRINEERTKRVEQEKKRLEEEEKTKQKTEVQMYVRGYLKNMTDSIFRTLQKLNYFYDPVEKEVEELYLPFLSSEIDEQMSNINTARSALKCMVDQSVSSSEERTRSSVERTVERMVVQVHKRHAEGTKDVQGLVDSLIARINEKAV
ncbi:hypothetical protein KP509_28G046000 [Ceratopteris richardii]|uniref:Uncharacterized protein n=2 Tax=Ceratopteris richardii TaxID=49495 RepID=A0A8T2RDH1_CERRI|nr:hypothetical protein KP509_28G046000 [Ceratopteris richardii]KAH7293867.1 hypothetical protein KP509_28G046000 [Ceratopteris richardii]